MNRPRSTYIAILTAVMVAALVGCKSSRKDSAEPKDSATQPTTSTAPAAYEKLSLPAPSKLRMEFQKDLKELTRNPHRLAGFEDGALRASRYVEKRLRQIGVDELLVQTFPVVQPVYTECKLFVDGKEVLGKQLLGKDVPVIYPMRPNLLQASVTPKHGLTGPTVYARAGETRDYGTEFPKDKIVVLDYECGDKWLNAFALGARAVLFIGQREVAPRWRRHVNIPANLPRFYLPREVAEKLQLKQRSRNVTIKAACKWKELRGRNVIAVLRGTAPKFDKHSDQGVALTAALDSLSEVPQLSPGARDAANVSALLQIAAHLKQDRPKRDVILCFFDGQTQCHAGPRAFYGAIGRHLPRTKAMMLRKLVNQLENERLFRRSVQEIITQKDVFDTEGSQHQQKLSDTLTLLSTLGDDAPAQEKHRLENEIRQIEKLIPMMRTNHRKAMRILQQEAQNQGSDLLEKLRPMRMRRAELQKEQKRAKKQQNTELTELLRHQIDLLEGKIKPIEQLELEWNSIQRDIHEKHVRAEAQPRFAQLVALTHKLCQERIEHLDLLLAEAQQGLQLQRMLGKDRNSIVLQININLGDARRRWGFVHGDDSVRLITGAEDKPGNYSTIFKAIRKIADRFAPSVPNFDARSLRTEYDVRWFAPGRFVDSGAGARLFAVFNLSVMTALDRLDRQGQPTDTLELLDQETMLAQVREVAGLMKEVLDHPDISLARSIAPSAIFNEPTW